MDVTNGPMSTLSGSSIQLRVDGNGGVTIQDGGVNTARVLQGDVEASNGIVHLIDAVLVPPNYVQATLEMMGKGGDSSQTACNDCQSAAACYTMACQNGQMQLVGVFAACSSAKGVCDHCFPESACGDDHTFAFVVQL